VTRDSKEQRFKEEPDLDHFTMTQLFKVRKNEKRKEKEKEKLFQRSLAILSSPLA